MVTGAANGAMGVFSNGLAGSAGKAVMKAAGMEALETTVVKSAAVAGGKAVVEQAAKNVTLSAGKQMAIKAGAFVVEATIDGGLSGAMDAFSRDVAQNMTNGEDEEDKDILEILKDTTSGFVGGAAGGIVIGGAMRGASKLGNLAGETQIGQNAGQAIKKISGDISETLSDGLDMLGGKAPVVNSIRESLSNFGVTINDRFIATSLKNAVTQVDDNIYSVAVGNYSVQIAKEELSEEIIEAINKGDNSLIFAKAQMVISEALADAGETSAIKEVGEDITQKINEETNKEQTLETLSDDRIIETYEDDGGYEILYKNESVDTKSCEVNLDRQQELLDRNISSFYAQDIAQLDDAHYKKVIDLLDKGLNEYECLEIAKLDDIQYSRVKNLLENGVNWNEARSIVSNDTSYEQLFQQINSTPNPVRDFLNSENYTTTIKKATQGRYQKELMQMLDLNTMSYTTRKSLLESGLSEEELIESIKKISKSTFKLAMNTPNQYLSDIDIVYTTKINGKYPQLPEDVLKTQQEEVMKFFSEHIGEMSKALEYIDVDTLNQMMDKRTRLFAESLANLNKLTDENYSLLSKLIKTQSANTGKALTAREKIQLCQIMEIYQEANIDNSILQEMINADGVDLQIAKQTIQDEILLKAGINKEQLANIPVDKRKFNEEYSYLALKGTDDILDESSFTPIISGMRNASKEELAEFIEVTELSMKTDEFLQLGPDVQQAGLKLLEMYKDIDKYSDEEICKVYMQIFRISFENYSGKDELYTIIRESTIGDFNEFITDTLNKYGQTNALTRQAFIDAGLDYEKWLAPDIDDVKLDIDGKKCQLKCGIEIHKKTCLLAIKQLAAPQSEQE